MRWIWIENTDGKQDTMLTFAIVAMCVVITKVLLGGVPIKLLGTTYTLTAIDAATIGALLTPTLTAYVARRYTDKKFTDTNNNGVDDTEEAKK